MFDAINYNLIDRKMFMNNAFCRLKQTYENEGAADNCLLLVDGKLFNLVYNVKT